MAKESLEAYLGYQGMSKKELDTLFSKLFPPFEEVLEIILQCAAYLANQSDYILQPENRDVLWNDRRISHFLYYGERGYPTEAGHLFLKSWVPKRWKVHLPLLSEWGDIVGFEAHDLLQTLQGIQSQARSLTEAEFHLDDSELQACSKGRDTWIQRMAGLKYELIKALRTIRSLSKKTKTEKRTNFRFT